MNVDKIIVNGARVLVKEHKLSEETDSGIVLPGREKEHTNQGIILAVGNGSLLENGTKVPVQYNVGDKVLYTAFSGSPIVMAGDEEEECRYLILNERDILCKILD